MASNPDHVSMAVFCDFENVALGVRDANYDKFDIKPILERLLLKGSIVVKKAYCDWERYKGFKATMHEANFELIEIPHVRQSGKNSADIRLVVDALDLCYTKSHVNTFVIISGDSDFSPLVSKLRENAKQVIGVGVKQSTSDLLVANCDEFIFYDDLVRESRRAAAKREPRNAQQSPRRTPEEESKRKDDLDKRKNQAVDMVMETFDALISERGDGKVWASLLKDTVKRRRPDFSETYYGFRTFGNLLEEAQARGLLEFGRDEKSGAYAFRSSGAQGAGEQQAGEQGSTQQSGSQHSSTPQSGGHQGAGQHGNAQVDGAAAPERESRRGGRGGRGRKQSDRKGEPRAAMDDVAAPVFEAAPEPAAVVVETATDAPARKPRAARKPAAPKAKTETAAPAAEANSATASATAKPAKAGGAAKPAKAAAAKKPAARGRRPSKAEAGE